MAESALVTIERRKLLGVAVIGGLAAGTLGRASRVAAAEMSSGTPSTLVFDVNETLLDIDYLGPVFERVFGDRRVLREWFNQLILYSDAISLAGPYTTFFDLGQGVLEMLGSIYKARVTPADIEELRTRLLTMPAHPDVAAGLQQLKDAGFRLVSFTNSPPDPAANPLRHAGIDRWFERSFSVDSVRRFKPAAQGYHFVAEQLDVRPSSLCMVAAHVWDTIGAQSVGYAAALIARPGNAPLPVPGLPQPQIVAPDLPGVAALAIKMWRS
jgi:2-haloacid dehalogenase